MYTTHIPTLVVVCVLLGMSLPTSSMPIRNMDILSGEDFLSMFIQSARSSTRSSPGPDEDSVITTTMSLDENYSIDNINSSENSFITEEIGSYTTESLESTERTVSSHYTKQPEPYSIDRLGLESSFTERGHSSYDKDRFTLVQSPNNIQLHSTRHDFSVDESSPVVRLPEKVKRKSEDLLAIGANPDYIAQQQSRLNRDSLQFQHPYNRQLSRSKSVSYSAVIQAPWKQNITESTAESKDYFVTHKYQQQDQEFNDSLDKNGKKNYEPTERNWGIPEKHYDVPTVYGKPEQNYEIDEAVSVITNGRVHGVQPTEKPSIDGDDNQKVGYVVEGRNFRKYRVEERTSDGFIVGEYGVVSNNDGSLRGVRYTADGTINPRVIYDALMKFLAL